MLYDVRCSTYDISLAIAGSTLRITSSVTMSSAGLVVMSSFVVSGFSRMVVSGFSRLIVIVSGFIRLVVSGFSRTNMNDQLPRLGDAQPVSRKQQRRARVFL